jgi:hypothetical protein
LRSGKILRGFVAVRNEKVQFFRNYPRNFSERHDEKCKNDLYFLRDIACHLSELILQFQGKAQLIFEMITATNKMKLRLFTDICLQERGVIFLLLRNTFLCESVLS